MGIDKGKVKRILVITLSNVGDVILTTPVVEVLMREFPSAGVDIMVGPNAEEVFKKHPKITKLMIYDKHIPFARKIALLFKLRSLRYDLVADIRNTVFPYLLGNRYRTRGFRKNINPNLHKRDIHLSRIEDLGIDINGAPFYLPTDTNDENYINTLLAGIKQDNLVLISPGAKSRTKRWPAEYFTDLCDMLHDYFGAACVLIGDRNDRSIADQILTRTRSKPLDLVEKTTLTQLASLMKRARVLITNDSAPLHVASAVNTPAIAIFGPTDERKYGPCSEKSIVIRNPDLKCAPCEAAQCGYDYECMRGIGVEKVIEAAKNILA